MRTKVVYTAVHVNRQQRVITLFPVHGGVQGRIIIEL
jgi:hypothetical protein